VKEMVPRVSRIAALHHTDHPMARKYGEAMDRTAKTLGLTLQILEARDVASLERTLSMMAKTPPGALIVPASPLFGANRRRIADFVVQRGIPAVGHDRSLAVDGLLMAYGPSIADTYRRGAAYVDKILKGAKPADLPVEQPTKFELVINFKTAKALGLTVPPSLLLRADHVIE
jgi:putative tryptophan/tyrosine transport system substrate-binding protein